MTRVLSFSDGFTSSSAPSIQGGTQEDYPILNNQVAPLELFSIDSSVHKSAFMVIELSRSETGSSFLQAAHGILSFNGIEWELSIGNYQGDDLIQEALTTDKTITLSVSTASGVGSVKYTSGNMATVYAGELKMFITRIAIA